MYLNTHSYYSLRYGTMPPEDLLMLAQKNGLLSFALTDINNTMGIPLFVKLAKKYGVRPIAGADIRNNGKHLYTIIARNNKGLQELNEFISVHNISKKSYPAEADNFDNVFVIYPFGSRSPKQLRDNELAGIQPREVRKLFTSEFRNAMSKLVILQPVTFADREGFFIHQNLRAIDNNILISKLNGQQTASLNEIMMPVDKLLSYYKDYPGIIRNTEKIIDECSIDFDFNTIKNKKTFTGNRYDDRLLLEKLSLDGLQYRYGNNREAEKRMRHEVEVICRLGFASYFLIAWDIIRYSMSRGFYHVGRGSGANSIVAYCLKITDVDPIDLDLYFERFINPKRTSPPDFDIDYSWKDRDDVQDYIFKRYGSRHAALLGATSTFRGRSIYRELGKVYGLPKAEIDGLVHHPEADINKNDITMRIHRIAQRLFDFPNIRSIHAGGVLISEDPVTCYTALDLPPKGFPTTQWDMYVAEDLGYEKFDILSQRGIGHIREAADLVRENRKINIDVHRVEEFKKDEQVRHQLKTGETIGCFYIESPAMRGLLKKLKCDDYITLVAASSIIRPGVARSGMMREYIRRFHFPGDFEYLHPVMEEQLKETYGVMVYQEDVIKVAHHFAGLDLSDADILRRAMSGKYRSKKEFDRIAQKFFDNCRTKGYTDKLTKEVWRQIESFAGYSFSKAHSASYAVESFQSLYLKAHFPLEFMVAVINNFGGFYRGWVYFNEAKRWGACIELPCVNNSRQKTCIKGEKIYTGFVHIENLEHQVGKNILKEREQNGKFTGLEDFVSRVRTGIEQLIILIRTGAFRFTGKPKAHLLWEAHMLTGKSTPANAADELFRIHSKKFKLPDLEHNILEDAYDELEYLGFPVSMSMFDMLQTSFRGEIPASDLEKNIGKKVRMVGRYVTIKYVRTIKKEIMNFGTFVDVKGEFFDTTHFPDSVKKYPFRGSGCYLILGKVVEEFGFPGLEVEKMAKLPLKPDPRG